MFKKTALALLFAVALAPAASFAQVAIRVGPPPPVYEHRGPAPDREHVWIDGHHRYDGDHYTWEAGRWERPPHHGDHWVAARWTHHHGEWVMVEGHWR